MKQEVVVSVKGGNLRADGEKIRVSISKMLNDEKINPYAEDFTYRVLRAKESAKHPVWVKVNRKDYPFRRTQNHADAISEIQGMVVRETIASFLHEIIEEKLAYHPAWDAEE